MWGRQQGMLWDIPADLGAQKCSMEAQAGAAFAEKGEGMLGGCSYQQEKLLSGKAYPDIPGYKHQMLIELGQQLCASFC